MRALVLVAAAGCWTGSDTPAAEPTVVAPRQPAQVRSFKLMVERTACDGDCPVYMFAIYGDGRVVWEGRDNVAALGVRRGRVSPQVIASISDKLDEIEFFERDDYGYLPMKPECTTVGNTTTCSMRGSFSICSDSSRTIMTATRRGRSHTIDNANCSADTELAAFESYVGSVSGIAAWIGGE